MNEFIAVAQPDLSGNEWNYVRDCVESGWVSSNGKYIDAFERAFAEYCGVRHAIATNNGTTALHLALKGLGVGPGDEVIIPTVTYIATANAVAYCGATPVPIDVDPVTLNIDASQVASAVTERTRGVIAVHLYGIPARMDALVAEANRFGLWVLEDAAEAHGATVGERRVGSIGEAATFSFYGNKIMTTGEGGMVCTDNEDLASQLRLLRGQGMDPERRYWFEVVGFNYRMTNIQAALGLAQLERVSEMIAQRDALARFYDEALTPLSEHLVLRESETGATPVNWMYNVFVKNGGEIRRDFVMERLLAEGVETRPTFCPMHVLPPYRTSSLFPVADFWAPLGINLPTHTSVTKSDVRRIADALGRILETR